MNVKIKVINKRNSADSLLKVVIEEDIPLLSLFC